MLQRFTAPFGLLGDEPKLSFRSQPNGISKLAATRHISETDSYWDQYTTLFDSASDVFSLIAAQDVRRALAEAPENVATLLRVIISRLFNLVSDHTFPSSSNASVTALASSIIRAGTGSSERNTTKEVLNCLRILQRVLPIIFEIDAESSAFETEVLWKQPEEDQVSQSSASQPEAQFVIDDDEDAEDESGEEDVSPAVKPEKQAEAKQKLPSLAEKLFGCLIDLLFCCGFTLPSKIQVDHYKINYVIWEKGVGSTADLGPNHAYDSNKTEVLRLLLVLLSRQIYLPSNLMLSSPSSYTLHFVQKTPRRNILTILCSLLNTAMNSPQSTIESIGDVAGKLPYNHLVFKGEDARSTLVSVCLQVLCVLLDFQSGNGRDPASGGEPAPTATSNAFRYFLMKLHRTQDFTFIMEGIAGILEQDLTANNNILPGSKRPTPYLPETVLFFWKIIELNKKFRVFVLESDRGLDIFAYMLCYCLEIKDRPQQHGLCRVLSYIIQSLSAEPALGSKLTKPVKARLPSKWIFPGNAGDFIVNSIYSIVATTSGALNSLYPALIIALSNLSPYFMHLTVTSSARLIQLLNSFSNPMFLLSDEGHPRLLFFMLEVFNGPILYNPADNANLIYAIIGAHKTFERLGTFTLAQGLRDVHRIQSAKDDPSQKSEEKKISQSDDDTSNEKFRLMSIESQGRATPQQTEDQSPDSQDASVAVSSPPPVPTPSEMSALPSQKSRGKMKERRSLSTDDGSIPDGISAMGVGRNGFVPTQEWVTSWQKGLPLDTVMLMITELLPKIQEMQRSRQKAASTTAIMDFLGSIDLKHVLPEAPPITPRKFLWSDTSIVWLTSLIWGEIYVKGMSPLGIWNGTNVRLFYVKHAQTQSRQITETVSNVVGGLLGRTDTNRSRPER